MSIRCDIRLPEEVNRILVLYCKETGASRTGAIVMLIRSLKERLTPESKVLLVNGSKVDTVN
jgi:hypothetical protein